MITLAEESRHWIANGLRKVDGNFGSLCHTILRTTI